MNARHAASLGLLLLASLASCSSQDSSSGTAPPATAFLLSDVSAPDGAVWQVNRPIDLTFSAPVDFSTISSNSVSLRDGSGMPAIGTFELVTPSRVRFQPACPLEPDLSDAGLALGGVVYGLQVWGTDSGMSSVVGSASGQLLEDSHESTLVTSLAGPSAFFDPKAGPPLALVRALNPDGSVIDPGPKSSYIVTGSSVEEFVAYPATGTFGSVQDQGLNLYSVPESAVHLMLELDQPVHPSSQNISSERIALEVMDPPGSGLWVLVPAELTLEANCAESGTTIRIDPVGVLPQGRELRLRIDAGFEDLSGNTGLVDQVDFARFQTLTPLHPGLVPVDREADEYLEDFAFGGVGTMEDVAAEFAEPKAVWGESGKLSAALDFEGKGGSDGAFDWVIPSGVTIVLDSSGNQQLTGGDLGPDASLPFVPSKAQSVSGGVIDVRHLVVQEDAILRLIGPKPFQVRVSGKLILAGRIDLSGFDAADVATLGTGHLPEPGAAGAAGGGTGGVASWLVTSSTPQGGSGLGPLMAPGGGGGGGESGHGTGPKLNRRPGGGGGGALAADALGATDIGLSGTAVEPGWDGGGTGALTGLVPAAGGSAGPLAFTNGDPGDDYYGASWNGSARVPGELSGLIAGAGGGAGGDAIPSASFPHPTWSPSSDEKGCGGAGGAGGLELRVLGDILVKGTGRIAANGGRGGSGESTIGNDHLGGGSGGGSGGHVILMTGGRLIFDGVPANALSAVGGAGGAGVLGTQSTNAGGSGGPGLIQVHVHDPANHVVVKNPMPGATSLEELCLPDAQVLLSDFGRVSRARSKWLGLGGMAFTSSGSLDAVSVGFGGLDLASGDLLDADGDDLLDDEAVLIGPVALGLAPALPHVAPDGAHLLLDASSLAGSMDDLYLRNPRLLRFATIELEDLAFSFNRARFRVAEATYDEPTGVLDLLVEGSDKAPLHLFQPPAGSQVRVFPRSVGPISSKVPGAMTPGSLINLRFQGAKADALGLPDLSAPLVDWTSDPADFAAVPAGDLDFLRFEVRFEVDQLALDSELPALDWLRVRFGF
ncbi:MAG: hypothetical protein P1V81_00135 [Planctomycetota bacterium]|nr:hypothetical protein [Planctomycetota bacterium]